MAVILHDVTTACIIDDALIYGLTQQEHDDRLRAVMDRLRRHNVTLNDKCVFSVPGIKWAGYVISGSGVQPDPDGVRVVVSMPPPNNVTEVRCFLGMVSQMAKFANNLAQQSAPIRDLLRKDRVSTWDVAQQTAFDTIQRLIASTPVLVHYNPSLPTIVSADSSSFGLGTGFFCNDRPTTHVDLYDVCLKVTQRGRAQVCPGRKRMPGFDVGLRTSRRLRRGDQVRPQTARHLAVASPGIRRCSPRIQRLGIGLMRYDYSVVYVAENSMGTVDAYSAVSASERAAVYRLNRRR
jgi:hypothetical protein